MDNLKLANVKACSEATCLLVIAHGLIKVQFFLYNCCNIYRVGIGHSLVEIIYH
jgi:hypothetical protein